jgi:hypothetical protein
MERRLSTGGSCQAVWGREGLAAALDHAAPADIARKLLRRRALEAHHPELQAALAGIDVLDVTAAGRGARVSHAGPMTRVATCAVGRRRKGSREGTRGLWSMRVSRALWGLGGSVLAIGDW